MKLNRQKKLIYPVKRFNISSKKHLISIIVLMRVKWKKVLFQNAKSTRFIHILI